MAGVPGIDDQRHRLSDSQACDDLLRCTFLVMLVCCQQARLATVVAQQRRAVARILGGHPGHLAQNLDRPLRHVAQMAERGRNHI